MTELATIDKGATLVLDADQTFFTDPQIKALEHIGVENASYGDLQVFHHVCQRTGLDPFARQIYMIGRKSSRQVNGQWVDEWKQTIQTGIDGFRLIGRRAADRAKHSVSVGAPEWAHHETGWQELWIRSSWGLPVAARVTIHRDGQPFTAVALFDEYKQTKQNGDLTKMWGQRPAGQLAKCAEALAWRMAFPQDLSGIYVDEELQHADGVVVQGEAVQSGGLGAALAAQETAEQGPSGPGEDQEIRGDAPDPADQGVVGDQPGPESSVPMVTEAQLKNIGRLMGKTGLNITDREEALVKVAVIIGREIETRKDLTRDEASKVIDSIAADLDSREK